MQFDIKKKKNFNYKIVNAILFDQLMKVRKGSSNLGMSVVFRK